MQQIMTRTRRHDITFSHDGTITVGAYAANLLDLQHGDGLNVAVIDGECYLYAHRPTLGQHYAVCFPTNRRGRNFRARSTRLARLFLNATGVTAGCASFAVGEPLELYGKVYLPLIKRPL